MEMKVEHVGFFSGQRGAVVVLSQMDGDGLLPVFVGVSEAKAIAFGVNGVDLPRPLTHDLLVNVIQSLDASVARVVIHEIKDETFFATLDLKTPYGILEVDARPSDAIALAVRTGCPILCEEMVLAQAAVTHEDVAGEEA